MPAPVVTVTQTDGVITTEWTYTDQKSFKVAIVNENRGRHGEPGYGTERFKGQFSRGGEHDPGNLQAHWIGEQRDDPTDVRNGRNIQSIRWTGAGVSSDRICTGTWIVIVRCRNNAGTEDLTTVVMGNAQRAARTISADDWPCSPSRFDEDDREGAELPQPTLTADTTARVSGRPNFADTATTEAAQRFTFSAPAGQNPSGWKLSIYERRDVGGPPHYEPLDSETAGRDIRAIGGSWRSTEPRSGSHWIYSGARNLSSLTFLDAVTAATRTTERLCNGVYVARVRYQTAGRRNARGDPPLSAARAVLFSVSGKPCLAPETPTGPVAPPIPEGQDGILTILTGEDFGLFGPQYTDTAGTEQTEETWSADIADLNLRWSVFFRSGLPQTSYKVERRVWYSEPPDPSAPGEGAHHQADIVFFNGNETGVIWETTDQTIASANTSAVLRGNAPSAATNAVNGDRYWWGPNFGVGADRSFIPSRLNFARTAGAIILNDKVEFRVTAYDSAGNSAQSEWLAFYCSPRILVTDVSYDEPTIGGRTYPRISITASDTLGATVERFKVAIYDYENDVEGEIKSGTIRAAGQEIPPAHWTPWELTTDAATRPNPIRAVITPSLYMSHALESGDYLAAVKVEDSLKRDSSRFQDRQTQDFEWRPPEPQRRDIIPMRIVRLDDDGDPVFETPPSPATFLTGLGPGIGIIVAYFRPWATTPPADETAKPTPDDAIIQRREFSRNDGRPVDATPRDMFRFADIATGPSTLPAGAGVTAYRNLQWFYDYTVTSGVQYEYRVILLDTRTGGRREGDWLPVDPPTGGN